MTFKTLENKPLIITQPVTILEDIRRIPSEKIAPENPVFAEIIEEIGQDVYDYLASFKLTHQAHVIYLSSVRHYLYGLDDIKLVKTVLNFRSLNRVSHLWFFLVTINHILPLNGYFAGCFLDYNRQKQNTRSTKHSVIGYMLLIMFSFLNRIVPKIPLINKIQLLLNKGMVKSMTKDEARNLLEKNGFLVIDMTEIDGLTYFIAQKISHGKMKTFSLLTLINSFKTKSQIINI